MSRRFSTRARAEAFAERVKENGWYDVIVTLYPAYWSDPKHDPMGYGFEGP